MAIKRKRKSVSELSPFGTEPEWNDEVPTSLQLSNALNWYSKSWEPKKSVSEFFKVYKDTPSRISALKSIANTRLSPTMCHLVRMQSRGCKLAKKHTEMIRKHLEYLISGVEREKAALNGETKKVVSIQDAVRDKAREITSDIDAEFDKMIKNKFTSDFSTYNFLQANAVKPLLCNYIIEVYTDMAREFMEVASYRKVKTVDGDDAEQLVEAYKHISTKDLAKILRFISSVINDATAWRDNAKKVRKPRKKKDVPVEKKVAKVKYQKEYTPLKLASINPSEILGAQQLWVYNTKYNTVTVYNALDESGLSIKGTSLQNISDTSLTKKIRGKTEVLKSVLKGGKIVLRKLMDEINTKGTLPTSRLNENTVLLRVVK